MQIQDFTPSATRTFVLVCIQHDSSLGLAPIADTTAVDDENDNADKRQDSDHNASHAAATTRTNSIDMLERNGFQQVSVITTIKVKYCANVDRLIADRMYDGLISLYYSDKKNTSNKYAFQ